MSRRGARAASFSDKPPGMIGGQGSDPHLAFHQAPLLRVGLPWVIARLAVMPLHPPSLSGRVKRVLLPGGMLSDATG